MRLASGTPLPPEEAKVKVISPDHRPVVTGAEDKELASQIVGSLPSSKANGPIERVEKTTVRLTDKTSSTEALLCGGSQNSLLLEAMPTSIVFVPPNWSTAPEIAGAEDPD